MPPSLDLFLHLFLHHGLLRHLDLEEGTGFVFEVVWVQRMALHTRASDNKTVSVAVGMRVALGMRCLSMWSEVRRSLLEVQERRIPQDYGYEMVGYVRLRNEVGIL